MESKWITVDDICKYLNVSNETIYKWIEQRNLPAHKVGRRWMFRQDQVDHWIQSGAAGSMEKGNHSKRTLKVKVKHFR